MCPRPPFAMSKPIETLNVIIPSMSGASSTLSGNLPKYTYPQYRSSISTSYGSSRSISLELPDWSYENIIAMGATSGTSRLRRRSAVEVGVIGMANTSSETYGLPLWSARQQRQSSDAALSSCSTPTSADGSLFSTHVWRRGRL